MKNFCFIMLLAIVMATNFSTASDSKVRNHTLMSPQRTNWGSWGEFEYCPHNQYVVGMSLKTEGYQGVFHDDSGLNAIKFFCSEIGSGSEEIVNFITSKEGDSGNYGNQFYCNGVATGFQMLSEKDLGAFNDDTAASNLRLICDGKSREGDGVEWGSWTEAQNCEPHTAICGLQTQVEDPNSDDTSLNNIQVQCCPVPDPASSCVPTDQWDLILECDNTEATSPTTCKYERKIGTSSWAMLSESQYMMSELYANIGFGIPTALLSLPGNFEANLGFSMETGFNWTHSSGELYEEEVTTSVDAEVPPGIKTKLLQTLGSCSFYHVRANIIKRIDYDATTRTESVSYIKF